MRKTIFTFTLIITAILGVQAQTSRSGKLKGSGVIVTETRAARAFNSIKVGRAIEVVMKNDTDGKIIVRADDNVMPFVKTRFEGLELVIGVDKTVSLDNASIQVDVPYNKNMRDLSVSGAASIKTKLPLESYELDIDVSGAGCVSLADVTVTKIDVEMSGASSLNIDKLSAKEGEIDASGASCVSLNANDLYKFDMDVSGASNIDISGSATYCNLDVSGASVVSVSKFRVKDYNVDLSGASKVEIQCTGTLAGEVTGASSLSYVGKPVSNRITKSATSRIVSK